jgi:hypothetical protein
MYADKPLIKTGLQLLSLKGLELTMAMACLEYELAPRQN